MYGTLSNCIVSCNSNSYPGGQGGGAAFSTLINCSVVTNWSPQNGGGAFVCLLNNCVLRGNRAAWGGGAISSTLNSCLVVANTAYITSSSGGAQALGGGIWGGVANNCTIATNSVVFGFPNNSGGGSYGGALNNCIVYYNTGIHPNYDGGTINNCCITPLPASGSGNFTASPLFVSPSAGDFHLQSQSPCINAGKNSYVSSAKDLGGNPRTVAGTVDVGAYEFQAPASVLSYAWAQQFGLATDGSADFKDTDHDGMNNWQEWQARTDPTTALSVLKMLPPATNPAGKLVTWQSVSGVTYFLQRSTNLTQPFSMLQTNIAGNAGTTGYTDTPPANGGPYFYRVGVQ
jgi:hypothetical protein